MFRTWVFTEMPYPSIPPADTFESARVTLPNEVCDPKEMHDLYRKYLDIYAACDELGLDIMLNEHHQTATCLNVTVPLFMAILARETRQSRILALGNPIANRSDPVRIAEEMAQVDVLSGGRVDVGFVRGVPQEISATNTKPVDMWPRFWEACDLIVKAWTTHDGPFNWEGEHYHHRQVNVWPRPYQQPHPPLWVPTQTPSTAEAVGERGYNLGTILSGTEGACRLFTTYRDSAAAAGRGEPSPERLSYCALVYVGETHDQAMDGARQLDWYLKNNKVADQFMLPPGYAPPEVRAKVLKAQAQGRPISSPLANLVSDPVEKLIEGGFFFAGTPDEVFEQMRRFHDDVGGFGNLLMMAQGGHMSYETTVRSLELYAEEVLPRFRSEVAAAA